MDHDAWSSVWKTDCFLAVCCRITGASGLEYIFARKCPLPSQEKDNMAELLDQFRIYRDQDQHECNLLLGRINALVISQTLFVTATSFLYSSFKESPAEQRLFITAVGGIALATAALVFVAIILGCRILRRWHRHGEGLIDDDTSAELKGCYLEPRRHLPDRTHRISID